MKWGLSFSVKAVYESDLHSLPPPSSIERGNGYTLVTYHFLFPPQDWREWQRAGKMKLEIQNRLESVEFMKYEIPLHINKYYTISELGADFQMFYKLPKAMYPGDGRDMYRKLCWYAQRLHYAGMLEVEFLVSAAMRFNNALGNPMGARQTFNSAFAAYRFADDNRDEWRARLTEDERHKVLSGAALKSAAIKRSKSKRKREQAAMMREEGATVASIADELGVSIRTVKRWLKNA